MINNNSLEHISKGLDQVMIDITVRCMLNPDNRDFYIGTLTVDKCKSMFAEMPSDDVKLIDIFMQAFEIARRQYFADITEYLSTKTQSNSTNTCPECGCRDYIAGVACPNCDYVEEV